MKVKTSITLSQDLLQDIDRHQEEFKSRSEFLEKAARGYLDHLTRLQTERRDMQIINNRADGLNAEAKDVLDYQVSL